MPANGNNNEVRDPSPGRKATFFKRHAAGTVFVVLFVVGLVMHLASRWWYCG